MLGLHGGISTAAKPDRILKSNLYTFESETTGWTAHSVQGTLTLQAGQSAPGSSDSDWMKCTFDTNQDDGNSGITTGNGWIDEVKVGDILDVSYDIHVVDDSGKWGTDPPVSFRCQFAGTAPTNNVALDTTVINESYQITANTTGRFVAIEVNNTPDRPQAGAVFYIRNIRLTLRRP